MPLAVKAFEICSPWEAAHGRLQGRGSPRGATFYIAPSKSNACSAANSKRAGPQNLHPGSQSSSSYSKDSSSSSLMASIPRCFTIFKKRPRDAHKRLLLFIRTACRTSMLHRATTAPRFLEGQIPMNTSSVHFTHALQAKMSTRWA